MFGNTRLLNRLIVSDEKNPIKKDIGKHSVQHLLDVIRDEYWDELARLMQYSDYNIFGIDHLGIFHTKHGKLKSYIWQSVKALRRLRKRIKKLEEKEGFDPTDSMTVAIHDDLMKKTSAAWRQLKGLQATWEINKSIKAKKVNKTDN